MAGMFSRFYNFMLFFYVCFSKASPDRRFSDFKRCADEECSMLLCRGKAAEDFSGPDCRFLSFKKGETIYVYYKLSGQRSDVWAGSVGSNFGYFPKDFLNINHIYTEKEVEVPAEETDFVCFDTGLDTFDSYDIDLLLSNSLLLNEGDSQSEKPKGIAHSDDTAVDTKDVDKSLEESPKDTSDRDMKDSDLLPKENEAEQPDDTEDVIYFEPTEPTHSPLESTVSETIDEESYLVGATSKSDLKTADDANQGQPVNKDTTDEPLSKGAGALDKSYHVTEVEALPELKTTLGTTFDAITSDDEDTLSVTPYFDEEESNKLVDQESEQVEERPEEFSLLPAAEELPHFEENILGPAESKDEGIPLEHAAEKQEDVSETTKDDMWSSLGDTVFNIVNGGERRVLLEDTEVGNDEEDEEKDTDPDKYEKDSEDQLHVQDSEINEDAEKMKHSNKYFITEDPIANDAEADETEQSNNDSTSEDPISSNDTKVGKIVYSDVNNTIIENPASSEDTIVSETKHSNIEPITEEPISQNIITDTVLSEKDTKTLQYETQGEELESDEKSELSKKYSDVVETFNDAVVRSERDTPTSNLEDDKSVEKVAEKTIQKETITESLQFHKWEALSKDGTQNVFHIDDKNYEEDVKLFEGTLKTEHKPEAEEESDISQKKDEQIEKAKKDVVHLFESTLKTEHKAEEESDIYKENEDTEELLDDENAILSKTEEVEKSTENDKSKAELENRELTIPKEPKENSSTQTIGDTESDIVQSLDSSVSAYDKINDTQSGNKGADEVQQDPVTSKEPEYSDSVLRLTLLRDHFKDDEMERFQRYLDLKDLLRVEAMFSELEQELKSARESNSDTSDDIERTLESILEVSENTILDEIEKMLDTREQKARDLGQQVDTVMFDEEAAILDDFQEFAFYLRQKYSAVSDSVPLVGESQSHFEIENLNASEEMEDSVKTIPVTEAAEAPKIHKEANDISNVNIEKDKSNSQDVGLEEDGGHFNKNKDIRTSFKDPEEVQRGPQAILENPLDIDLSQSQMQSSGALESSSASEYYDNKANYDQASTCKSDHVWGWLVLGSELLGVYAEILVAALPEAWQPGPTFHGLPWKPVVATATVGILTILMFIWRTILAVKSRTYQLTEKQLAEKIQQLVGEKSDVLLKITELNNMMKQHEEKLKNSEKFRSSTQQKFEGLKARYQNLLTQREELSVNTAQLSQKIADTQEENKTLNEKVVVMCKRIEKHQNSLKQYEEEHSKFQVLMDEAKLREDALKAQVLSFEKDNSALKEQKKSLLRDAKHWQEKHEKLSEEIKVYHKTQKDLEDSLVHKENEIDVLSSCIAELKGLEVCEGTQLQNSDAKLANGEAADKGDPIKLHIKQMMDVSRIKATLSVIEDERNRYLENFLGEQKARQALEEQFQKVVHDQTNLKNEKTHLESQYKNLQQRLEITTELYQQKENALQQRLTQEELERREKETKLSEVDGRALQAEEELNSLRQKVKDMQEEMQQNERALKAEIAVQEKKAHENWLKARVSERALIEERRESANLRQKIVECSDRMSDLEHALYKSGPPDRHMPPLRRGESYGPSPVSGGAPSPPLMIEGPGRPPSAPVGRRNEPFGPRPPSDPHGRFSDLGHPLPSRPELFAPRTSSPCTQDGSLSKSQSQGSFLPSPIKDSPGPTFSAPLKAYGPPPMAGPLPPSSNGPLPSMVRPPNGHPPMIPPGPPLGPDPRLKLPHLDSYGPSPLRPFGPVPPPFVCGPPPRDLPPMGPPPPPYSTHDFPLDFAGPRNLPFPSRPFPPGSLPPPGAMVPPQFGARDLHGTTPPMAQSSRDGEMTQATGHDRDISSPQGAAQDTATSAVVEP
ncbi:transport and Golgi organization protein 1 homolog isoform X2 [Colossoma macropomum]|uniref:transport and Golgi organization protein 1 homolog isoform X2 n=1 Tax=Colossoma macropomum TaxID=42526 RepID=UPI001863BC16|nr:transport and Golgi organization protein 1 homolog isoform X2 [Colossoma macropomum]